MTDPIGAWETAPTIRDEFTAMLQGREHELQEQHEAAEREKARRRQTKTDAAEFLGNLFRENDDNA